MSRFFNGIPVGGVLTDGNDTLRGSSLLGEVDAGTGEDLLIASYATFSEAIRVEIDLTETLISVLGPDVATFTGLGFTRHQITLGSGEDYIEASLGNATIRGGAGDDTFVVSGGNNRLYGGDGNDAFLNVALTDRIDAGRGNDVAQIDLRGGGLDGFALGGRLTPANWIGIETFVGNLTEGDDTLDGGARFISVVHPIEYAPTTTNLDAGAGDDLLILNYSGSAAAGLGPAEFWIGTVATYAGFGGFGSGWTGVMQNFDRFDVTGTAFADDFTIVDGVSTIRGGNGDDWFLIEGGHHTLHGDSGDDRFVVSGGGALKLIGGGGDDQFENVRLFDTVQGGLGRDTVVIDLTRTGQGPIWLNFSDLGANTNWSSIEAIEGRLTSGNDTLQGQYLHGNVDGGAGVDLLRLDFHARGITSVIFDPLMNILNFDDVSYGGPAGSSLARFTGFEKFDLSGTIGADFLVGDRLDDTLRGGAGDDTLSSVSGNNKLFGGSGNDLFYGGFDGDSISGGDGQDTISGAEGADTLMGGTGDDQISGGAQSDIIDGGRGNDTLWGDEGEDAIWGGGGNDLIFGGDGSDQLYGGLGNDTLIAGSDNDQLFGGSGNDVLVSEGNGDILSGGAGSDSFVFRSSFNGRATILDFGGRDKLVLDASLSFADLTFAPGVMGLAVSWDDATVLLRGFGGADLDPSAVEFQVIDLPLF